MTAIIIACCVQTVDGQELRETMCTTHLMGTKEDSNLIGLVVFQAVLLMMAACFLAGAWWSKPDQKEMMRRSKLCASQMVVTTKLDTPDYEECSLRNFGFQKSSVGTQCVEEKSVVKKSKTVMTQSQATYKRYLAQPRFYPLAERVHGAWSD